MKYLLNLVLFIPLLTSCNSSENHATELEGTWQTQCLGPFSAFNSTSDQKSYAIAMTFKGNNIDANIKTFTDNQCQTLESISPATVSNNFLADNKVPVSFSIGDSLTASNGLPAHELDLVLEDGEILKIAYQLLDNDKSLYFSSSCLNIPETQVNGSFLGGPSDCPNERSIDFSFSLQYIKQ